MALYDPNVKIKNRHPAFLYTNHSKTDSREMANRDIVKKSISEAMKALVRENVIENISVSDICDRSCVSRRTFYRYFSDKFEVLEWIYYNDFLKKIKTPGESSLYYYMSASVDLVLEDPRYYINAFKYRGQNSFRQYCSLHLSELVYPGFRKCFKSDDMYYLYMKHSNEMIFDFFEIYLEVNSNLTRDCLLEAFMEMLLKPSKRYVELLEQEYEQPAHRAPYSVEEPSRKPEQTG